MTNLPDGSAASPSTKAAKVPTLALAGSWSAAPLIVDRKTGDIKTIYVPRAAVSIVGGIQHGVLRNAIGREHMQDGLVCSIATGDARTEADSLDRCNGVGSNRNALEKVFDRLLAFEPAADEEGKPAPFVLPLSGKRNALGGILQSASCRANRIR